MDNMKYEPYTKTDVYCIIMWYSLSSGSISGSPLPPDSLPPGSSQDYVHILQSRRLGEGTTPAKGKLPKIKAVYNRGRGSSTFSRFQDPIHASRILFWLFFLAPDPETGGGGCEGVRGYSTRRWKLRLLWSNRIPNAYPHLSSRLGGISN